MLETRTIIGGHRAPHRLVALRTEDGVRLAASWLPGPRAEVPAVVLVHGFAANRRKPAYAMLADHLAGTLHVLSIDLRGHGRSGGRCRLGEAEWRDVHAAVSALRARGHRRIIVIGVSLGATAAVHALERGLEVEGAVLISASARHGGLSRPGMQDLDALWRSPITRCLWQAVAGFRMDPIESIPASPDPVALLAGTTTPLLLIHGTDDAYFGLEHAEDLRDAASGHVRLWVEAPGFGHAEDGITPSLCARVAAAVVQCGASGTFPTHR
ncbi:alpha/beta fold hydrolase [soil metagenome]